MQVLSVYTSYPLTDDDWRGRFMYDMVAALATHPDVYLRTWGPPGPAPNNTRYAASTAERDWLTELLKAGGIAHLLRHNRWKGFIAAARLLKSLRSAYHRNADVDVVHINWLQNAIPLLGIRVPAVISVLGTDIRLLSTPGMTSVLRRVFSQRRCIIAPNAEWMTRQLDDRFGDVAEIRPILFGIERQWYEIEPHIRAAPPRKWIAVLRLTRLKIGPLFEWGSDVFRGQDELHLFGPNQDKLDIPAWVHYHGPADPETLRQQWFPVAAGLVTLSQHDEGRPQVILEAMAARLPVIASDIPAHRDVVVDQETGVLVKCADDLRSAVCALSQPHRNQQAGEAAQRQVLLNMGTWEDCAERYVEAYHDVMGATL